jgi:regulator-associated protein of mTOR
MEGNRTRLLASSDPENLRSISSILSAENKPVPLKQLSNYFSDSLFLNQEWHEENNYSDESTEDRSQPGVTWRLKERMKTSGVALVVCLNIGIDPPDIIKPVPCATKECWFDPTGSKQKGLEFIGNALQQQYEKWQAKAKYKQCLDPTSEELRKVCLSLRKNSKSDRVLFHYNGHGVPKPTKNGELWVFGKYYTHYTPVAICELRSWLGDPAIYVLDCSAAGVLISHLVDNQALKAGMALSEKRSNRSLSPSQSDSYNNLASFTMEGPTIVLAACKANEVLPLNPLYPADLFTSCLTTPITTAIRWFILQVTRIKHLASPLLLLLRRPCE